MPEVRENYEEQLEQLAINDTNSTVEYWVHILEKPYYNVVQSVKDQFL